MQSTVVTTRTQTREGDAQPATQEQEQQQPAEPEVLWSTVCPHRVKSDIYSHCGCMA